MPVLMYLPLVVPPQVDLIDFQVADLIPLIELIAHYAFFHLQSVERVHLIGPLAQSI